MRRAFTRLIAAATVMVMASGTVQAFDTKARAAFIMDQTTGTVLLAKDADKPMPPASMSKLMTVYLVFEALRSGRLKPTDKLSVSQHAMDYGGSTMFLNTRDKVSVMDLLRGVIILSGNDASAVLAEALSPTGYEEGFAELMTRRAQELGMTNSVFKNSNGWPAEGHVMSVRDLALLANRLITDFPEYYEMFSETEFLFDGRAPQNKSNRNPLLYQNIGADGLKTGHTAEAGYGLVGSAAQGNRRVIFVISGLNSSEDRARESEAIVNWAFRQFAQKDFARPDQVIANASIWNGAAPSVPLVTNKELSLLVPVYGSQNLKADVVYQGPLTAPIVQGQKVADLVVSPEGMPATTFPLYAANAVEEGGFFNKIMLAAKSLIRQAKSSYADQS